MPKPKKAEAEAEARRKRDEWQAHTRRIIDIADRRKTAPHTVTAEELDDLVANERSASLFWSGNAQKNQDRGMPQLAAGDRRAAKQIAKAVAQIEKEARNMRNERPYQERRAEAEERYLKPDTTARAWTWHQRRFTKWREGEPVTARQEEAYEAMGRIARAGSFRDASAAMLADVYADYVDRPGQLLPEMVGEIAAHYAAPYQPTPEAALVWAMLEPKLVDDLGDAHDVDWPNRPDGPADEMAQLFRHGLLDHVEEELHELGAVAELDD